MASEFEEAAEAAQATADAAKKTGDAIAAPFKKIKKPKTEAEQTESEE